MNMKYLFSCIAVFAIASAPVACTGSSESTEEEDGSLGRASAASEGSCSAKETELKAVKLYASTCEDRGHASHKLIDCTDGVTKIVVESCSLFDAVCNRFSGKKGEEVQIKSTGQSVILDLDEENIVDGQQFFAVCAPNFRPRQ